jgi:nucleotide-binding universal stress UspA family protein
VQCEARQLAPALAATNAAVLADLVLFGADSARDAGPLAEVFAEVLLRARAPTLLVGGPTPALANAAIAWDGSAEAGRAVRAALPMLTSAKRITILSNLDDLGDDAAQADSARLTSYLLSHGAVEAESKTVRGADIARSLLEATRQEGCDLLISGAYGRPRLYELVLGGTTRTLVNSAGPPALLMAH